MRLVLFGSKTPVVTNFFKTPTQEFHYVANRATRLSFAIQQSLDNTAHENPSHYETLQELQMRADAIPRQLMGIRSPIVTGIPSISVTDAEIKISELEERYKAISKAQSIPKPGNNN